MPITAWAQTAPAPAPSPPATETAPLDAEDPTGLDPAAPAVDPPAEPVALEENTEPQATPTAPPVDTKSTVPLNEAGPPEPEFKPELEPEVFWEGDSDAHNPGYVPGYGGYRALSMNPVLPRAGAMPGGVTAPAGSDTWDEEWAFQFHGYMEATLRAGLGNRGTTVDGQSDTTIHATPIVPGRFGSFEASQAVPGPWVQMNFSYGNPYVTATAIIAGFNQSGAASYNYPSSQLGINDAYLTLRAPRMSGLRLKAHAGAFQDRYGAMAQYSEGNYGHSMVAYTRGTGVTVLGDFDIYGDIVGLFEIGIKGTLDKAPLGIEPTDANAYADASNGAGYVTHAHFGVALNDMDISAHWLGAFGHDDRLPTTVVRPGQPVVADSPDGRIDTFGLTFRAVGEPYGHFFFGGAHTIAKDARSVPRVINILNADGGRGLMDQYFGQLSGGNGSMTHVGFQYDMSLQKFLKYPVYFPSNDWNIRASFFGALVHVNSPQKSTNLPGFDVNFDNVTKLKLGSEVIYDFVSWAALGLRYDFIGPDLAQSDRGYQIISPRILFRTNFLSHEQINIRYTHWFYGDRVIIQNVAPNDPQGLDEHMVALQANMYF